MDDRTPEQRAADQALHEAVERVVRAYSVLPAATVITGWVVLGTGLGSDEDDDLFPDFTLLPDNGRGISHTQLIGIVRAGLVRAEASYRQPDTD